MVLVLMSLVYGHALEKEPDKVVTDQYELTFSTDPLFPVAYKETHLEVLAKDNAGNPLVAEIKIELHKDGQGDILPTTLVSPGHYDAKHVFKEQGTYDIHLIVNNEELSEEFTLYVDSLGSFQGIFQLSAIVLFLLIMIVYAMIDLKRIKKVI